MVAYITNFIDLSIFDTFSKNEIQTILILICITVYLELLNSIFLTGINSVGKIYISFYTSAIIDIFAKLLIALSGFIFDNLLYPTLIYFLFSIIKFVLLYYLFIKYNKHLFFSLRLISKKRNL